MEKVRILIIGLFVGIAIATTSTAFAKSVTVEKVDVKLVIDGRNSVQKPIIIDGISYLPVRTLAEALNFDVDWDMETRTVTVTQKSDE